jgi:hypothetical protein
MSAYDGASRPFRRKDLTPVLQHRLVEPATKCLGCDNCISMPDPLICIIAHSELRDLAQDAAAKMEIQTQQSIL